MKPAIPTLIRCVLCLLAVLAAPARGDAPQAGLDVDWPQYIAEQDLHWDTLPTAWTEAPFVGNGLMGSMIFQQSPTSLVIQLGRADVQDHRAESGKAAVGKVLPDQSRLPIGYFTLDTTEPVVGCDLRLNLYDAEISGTLHTEKGGLSIRAFMHSETMLLVVEVDGDDAAPFGFTWHPEEAFCPRVKGKRRGGKSYVDAYTANPPPVMDLSGPIKTCRQDLLSDGQTGTAWTVRGDGGKQTLFASVGHTFPQATAVDSAVAVVEEALTADVDQLVETHRAWWHDFYPRSFVSLPDQRLNSFYWIQHYKMACATKGGLAIADNQGPWLQPTGWPGTWWNLNVQLAYSSMLPANHPELAAGLLDRLFAFRENLRNNVPEHMRGDAMAINTVSGQHLMSPIGDPATEANLAAGNLLWALHNAYMQYRHGMDKALLRDKILPLLKPAVAYYFHFMIEGDDGRIHLPKTASPEYGRAGYEDCNYDLALLRWGCETLIRSCATLEIDDPMLPKWQDVLDRLVDYPTDDTGFMIGKDVPYATSHRHYSHLLMIYPLHLVNADQPDARPLIRRSVDHWQSLPEKLAGYSFTGSASMYAALGDGDLAEQRLQDFLNDKVLPNTFYAEGSPVIETPPAGARSIQDMLLQSWGDTIRVFPAVPDTWADVAFADLSAEGAFLVSAVRREGKTKCVRIESRAGEPCKVATGMTGRLRVLGIAPGKAFPMANGVVLLDLSKGETAVVVSSDDQEPAAIRPVKSVDHSDWAWGLSSTR